jgi:hypothetical protein
VHFLPAVFALKHVVRQIDGDIYKRMSRCSGIVEWVLTDETHGVD